MSRCATYRRTCAAVPTTPGTAFRVVASCASTLGCLFVCLLLAAAPDASTAAENLVQARFRPQTDINGFTYTVDNYGRVRGQHGWLFSGYQINRAGFTSQRQLMKPDGSEYVLEGRVGALLVRRRFRVDRRLAGVRIVDVVENTSRQSMAVTVTAYSQLGYRYQRMASSTLGAVSGVLGKKDVGIACLLQRPMQGLLLFHLAAPGSAVRPRIITQNNQTIQLHYTFTVAAGKTTSVSYTAALRRDSAMPDIKTLTGYFRPYTSRRYLSDLPREVRRTVVNLRSRGPSEDETGLLNLEGLLVVAPGSLDQLAFSEETLLRGTATCDALTVEGAHGHVTIPFARVAALVGERNAWLAPQVHLRDGQVLVGSIQTEGLRFALTSGLGVDLDMRRLDRLVLRADSAAEEQPPGAQEADGDAGDRPRGYYLVETFAGDRLRAQPESETMAVATPWGPLDVDVGALRRLYLAGEEQPGHWVELEDRSRFRAFLRKGELRMRTALFGSVRFGPHTLRRILFIEPPTRRRAPEEESDELLQPHLLLAGGDVLVGRIDTDVLHFMGPGGVVPQPPAQIRLLRNEAEGQLVPEGEVLRFRADIWGGGHLTGELRELVVPVRTARGPLRIPVRDLVEVHVPTPLVPEVLRVRLRTLIADLGHTDWERREAASKALEEMGELARVALRAALQETKDPEVERRVRRLLDRL